MPSRTLPAELPLPALSYGSSHPPSETAACGAAAPRLGAEEPAPIRESRAAPL